MARVGMAALVLVLAACAAPAGRRHGSEALTGELKVAAAASLAGAFAELGRRFEAEHPGATVSFAFTASSTVVHQVRAGAPYDVVAVAGEDLLAGLAADGLVAAPRRLATNRLAILVAAGNPRRVSSLGDLGRPGLAVVLCAVEVPCGSLAAKVLAGAGVRVRPRSYEPNVRAVVARVVLGEADAGLVYATDARSARPRAEGVPIPAAENAVTAYALSRVRDGERPALADAFVDFAAAERSLAVLTAAGFGAP